MRGKDHYEMREYTLDIVHDEEDSSFCRKEKLYPIYPSKAGLKPNFLRDIISRFVVFENIYLVTWRFSGIARFSSSFVMKIGSSLSISLEYTTWCFLWCFLPSFLGGGWGYYIILLSGGNIVAVFISSLSQFSCHFCHESYSLNVMQAHSKDLNLQVIEVFKRRLNLGLQETHLRNPINLGIFKCEREPWFKGGIRTPQSDWRNQQS